MMSPKLVVCLSFAASLAACSANLHPTADQLELARTRLVGKWQAKGSIFAKFSHYTDTQFEFFADGSVAVSGKSRNGWIQERTGTFKFVDSTHIKIDEGWEWGTTIYKVDWQDNDHVILRVADNLIIPLHRVN